MQILKEQLSASSVPVAVVGMQPPHGPHSRLGGVTIPNRSDSASQGPKEVGATVKPVTGSRYPLRPPTGHAAATRSPGTAGQWHLGGVQFYSILMG